MSAHEQETRQWLQYVDRDLRAARTLMTAGDAANACYHSQQSAVKALKAINVFSQIQYPPRHDLDVLRNGLPTGWVIASQYPDLADLTAWASEARYPTELPDATNDDARAATTVAYDVYQSVLRNMHDQGFNP